MNNLGSNKIYLFYCDLRSCLIADATLRMLLNESDQIRFDAFKNQARRRQFGIGRWAIKKALQELFGVPISHHYLLHEYQNWVVGQDSLTLRVSISHSGEFVAVAITPENCKLGVDIEQHKSRNYAELLDEIATPNEKQCIAESLELESAFYRLWTAKEALLKASRRSIAQVCREDLSASLFNRKGHVAGYHYHFQFFAQVNCSLTLLCSEKLTLQQYWLHSDNTTIDPTSRVL